MQRASKAEVRAQVWAALTESGVGIGAVADRIPNFVGSDEAAARLSELPSWHAARTVKANPDHAQQAVRALALKAGKLLFMAVPRLARPEPFYRLDPGELGDRPERAAERRVAAELAPTVSVEAMAPIDFIVCGSVAVNHEGVRIGKGAGYSDIEVGLLAEAGLLKPETTIVTTVHELQVLDVPLPHEDHDFTVDYVVTPERVITCSRRYRPDGIRWDRVTREISAAIPVLAHPRRQ